MSTDRQADAQQLTADDLSAVLRGVLLRATAPLIARMDQVEARDRDARIRAMKGSQHAFDLN